MVAPKWRLPELAGQAADAGGDKHERDGHDTRKQRDKAAEEGDGGNEAQGGWYHYCPDRCMACHTAEEAFMPGTIAVGHAIFPSLFTSQADISSSGSTISGRFAWMKASA